MITALVECCFGVGVMKKLLWLCIVICFSNQAFAFECKFEKTSSCDSDYVSCRESSSASYECVACPYGCMRPQGSNDYCRRITSSTCNKGYYHAPLTYDEGTKEYVMTKGEYCRGECVACSIGCSSCADFTGYCTACKDGYELLDNECVKSSSSGSGSNYNSGSSSSSGSGAVTCDKGYYLSGETCKVCSAGTYQPNDNTTATLCKACSTISIENGTCTSCSTTGECTKVSCNENYYENGIACKKCEDDEFYDTSLKTCRACSAHCKKCSSYTQCLSCESDYELSDGVCIVPSDSDLECKAPAKKSSDGCCCVLQ